MFGFGKGFWVTTAVVVFLVVIITVVSVSMAICSRLDKIAGALPATEAPPETPPSDAAAAGSQAAQLSQAVTELQAEFASVREAVEGLTTAPNDAGQGVAKPEDATEGTADDGTEDDVKPTSEPDATPPATSTTADTDASDKTPANADEKWKKYFSSWDTDAPPAAIAPFGPEQAAQHQKAWAKYLDTPVEYTNALGMKFRLIPPGVFTLGSTEDQTEKTREYLTQHIKELEKEIADLATEDAAAGDATGDATTGDAAAGDTAAEGTAAEGTAAEDTAVEDTAVEDTAAEDTAAEDTAAEGSDAKKLLTNYKTELKKFERDIHSETPSHDVVITRPFYLGVAEVTQRHFLEVWPDKDPYRRAWFSSGGKGAQKVANKENTDLLPVELVSAVEAMRFCDRLNKREGLRESEFYNHPAFDPRERITKIACFGYRLPSSAEWEFACRAGTTTDFWFGEEKISDTETEGSAKYAWFNNNSGGRTHSVGQTLPNPFGLKDVHGNVWEWCQDAWYTGYYREYEDRVAIDPLGPIGVDNRLIMREGAWNTPPTLGRAAHLFPYGRATHAYACGIRLVLEVDAVASRRMQTRRVEGSPAAPRSQADMNYEIVVRLEDEATAAADETIRLIILGRASSATPPLKLDLNFGSDGIAGAAAKSNNVGTIDRLEILAGGSLDLTKLKSMSVRQGNRFYEFDVPDNPGSTTLIELKPVKQNGA